MLSPVVLRDPESERLHQPSNIESGRTEIGVWNVDLLCEQGPNLGTEPTQPSLSLINGCFWIAEEAGLGTPLGQSQEPILEGHRPGGIPHLVGCQVFDHTETAPRSSRHPRVDGDKSEQIITFGDGVEPPSVVLVNFDWHLVLGGARSDPMPKWRIGMPCPGFSPHS